MRVVESFQDSGDGRKVTQGATFGSTLCWDIQSRWDSGTNHSDELFRVLFYFLWRTGTSTLPIFA